MTGDTSALTPGDVVLLEEGDRVAADGRLIESYDLRVDESGLTGESLPVVKQPGSLDADTNLAERSNMVYMSTVVLRGRARFLITDTGMSTEVGRIAGEIQSVEERPTSFQREIDALGKRITSMIAILIALIVVLQLTVSGFTIHRSHSGLSTAEAAVRLDQYGPNRLIETPAVSPLIVRLNLRRTSDTARTP